ncbi:ste ste20 paka protein kinase [Moniliophthora roreri]|nr:ste ste20 paka protein kinase [Moniliophthora roreri]
MLKEANTTSKERPEAPEIKRDKVIGPAVDVWSLGVLAIAPRSWELKMHDTEMFDGLINLNQERSRLIMDALNHTQPPSAPLRDFLNKTLYETPDLRPSASELLQASPQIDAKDSNTHHFANRMYSLLPPEALVRTGKAAPTCGAQRQPLIRRQAI